MLDIDRVKENFERRNIEFDYFNNRDDLMNALDVELSKVETVGIGNSKTLKALNVSERARHFNKVVYDKTLAQSSGEIQRLKKLALTSDIYISSANALGQEGVIVNVDHSGNRVAALTYGPDRVVIIVSRRKLVETEKQALKRALRVATPLNARRANIPSPCSLGHDCSQCQQDVRVCNYISCIRGQHTAHRMRIMMIDELLGF